MKNPKTKNEKSKNKKIKNIKHTGGAQQRPPAHQWREFTHLRLAQCTKRY